MSLFNKNLYTDILANLFLDISAGTCPDVLFSIKEVFLLKPLRL